MYHKSFCFVFLFFACVFSQHKFQKLNKQPVSFKRQSCDFFCFQKRCTNAKKQKQQLPEYLKANMPGWYLSYYNVCAWWFSTYRYNMSQGDLCSYVTNNQSGVTDCAYCPHNSSLVLFFCFDFFCKHAHFFFVLGCCVACVGYLIVHFFFAQIRM